MKILIATASRHGSTDEIGDAIAGVLREAGHAVDWRPVHDVTDVARYDAVVLGSAIYMGKWLPEARAYVEYNQAVLTTMPVWLFSSGPVGSEVVKAALDHSRVDEMVNLIHARGHRMFNGKLDREHLSFGERLTVALVRAPEGDFREWETIRAWAREIDAALSPAAVMSS